VIITDVIRNNIDVTGIGEPIYFYIEAVFLWNGIGVGILFLFGAYLRSVLPCNYDFTCMSDDNVTQIRKLLPIHRQFHYEEQKMIS